MKHLLAVLLVLLGHAAVAAQDKPSPSARPTDQVSPAGEPTPAHRQAVLELMELIQVEKLMTKSMDEMLRIQMEQNPRMAEYEDVLRRFFAKHLTYEKLRDDFVQMYAEAFSEDELKQLTVFYKTDLGRKTITLMPELMQKGARIGERRVSENIEELRTMIVERQKELEKKP